MTTTSVNTFEQTHVHVVYDLIAQDFSRTRHSRWPFVERFLDSLEPGSIVLDAGCGNGKYLGCRSVINYTEPKPISTKRKRTPQLFNRRGKGPETNSTELEPLSSNDTNTSRDKTVLTADKGKLLVIGFDMSSGLLGIAADRGHEVARGDCFNVANCWRSTSFDHAISIATIHHFATEQRRTESIVQLIRSVVPPKPATQTKMQTKIGRILIVVWALEQDDDLLGKGSARKSTKKGASPVDTVDLERLDLNDNQERHGVEKEQDVFVSWEKQINESKLDKHVVIKHSPTNTTNEPNDGTKSDDTMSFQTETFQRYYHLFRRFELARLVCLAAKQCQALYKQPCDYPLFESNEDATQSTAGTGEPKLVVKLDEERWERENWCVEVSVGWDL
ncbi:tRNA methyltransferase, has a role in tRNA modification [Microbotryomycetes sp. JL221]|nr:tRNA methyltransferase, has a role in tRNA modification [Microbotryomycetes sp. JL221]